MAQLNGKVLDGRELNVEYQGQSLNHNNYSAQDHDHRRNKNRHDDREGRGRYRNDRNERRHNDDNYYRSRSGKYARSQPSRVLFVGNLSFETQESAIENFFEAYGKIVDVRLAYSRDGASKGFGYVEFKYTKDSEDALNNLSG